MGAAAAPRLILASASPRRRELLHAAGYAFEVHPADIDEDDYPPTILPADLAEHLASLKAEALVTRFAGDVILAADTVVAFGDRPIGKPDDAADAIAMLTLLAGTTHTVITGVAVLAPGFRRSARVLSSVHLRPLSGEQIAGYVATGQWQGKAGGYGIQDEYGGADPFVVRMTGSHTNIVGLPMEVTADLLAAAGVGPTVKPPSRV